MITAAALLAPAEAVLFDFDGPLCHVFAGLPAPTVAQDLANLLDCEVNTTDPLEVLRIASTLGRVATRLVEDALISAEVAAVEVSTATLGGVESMRACGAVGLPVGIVSNNSAEAVKVFLRRFDLDQITTPLIGRRYLHPELMKPNSFPLHQALRSLGLPASRVVFVGDSQSDIDVARAVAMPSLAYVNKDEKRRPFEESATATVDSMWTVEAAIRAR